MKTRAIIKIISLVLIIALAVGIFLIYPRISCDLIKPVNQEEIFPVHFKVTNNGYLRIKNVYCSMFMHKLKSAHYSAEKLNSDLHIINKVGSIRSDSISKVLLYPTVSVGEPINATEIYIYLSFDLYFPHIKISRWYAYDIQRQGYLYNKIPLDDSVISNYKISVNLFDR